MWSTLSLHFFGVLNIICATNQSHSCYCKCELAVGCSASTGSLPALRNSRLKSSHLGECDVRCKRILKGILVISTFPGFSVFQKIEQEAPAAAVPRCCSLQSHFVQCLGGWGTKNYRPKPAGNGRRCMDTYEYLPMSVGEGLTSSVEMKRQEQNQFQILGMFSAIKRLLGQDFGKQPEWVGWFWSNVELFHGGFPLEESWFQAEAELTYLARNTWLKHVAPAVSVPGCLGDAIFWCKAVHSLIHQSGLWTRRFTQMDTRHFVTLSNWDHVHFVKLYWRHQDNGWPFSRWVDPVSPLVGVHHKQAAAVLQHLASLGNCPTLLEPGDPIKGDKLLSEERPCVLPRGAGKILNKSQRNVSGFRIACSFTVFIMDNLPNRWILDGISSWMRNMFIFVISNITLWWCPSAVSTQVGRLVRAWMLE